MRRSDDTKGKYKIVFPQNVSSMEQWGLVVVNSGKHNGKTYASTYEDEAFVDWNLSVAGSATRSQDLCKYFEARNFFKRCQCTFTSKLGSGEDEHQEVEEAANQDTDDDNEPDNERTVSSWGHLAGGASSSQAEHGAEEQRIVDDAPDMSRESEAENPAAVPVLVNGYAVFYNDVRSIMSAHAAQSMWASIMTGNEKAAYQQRVPEGARGANVTSKEPRVMPHEDTQPDHDENAWLGIRICREGIAELQDPTDDEAEDYPATLRSIGLYKKRRAEYMER